MFLLPVSLWDAANTQRSSQELSCAWAMAALPEQLPPTLPRCRA